MTELKPCPWCNGQAFIRQGKSWYDQLHGEEQKTWVIECRHKDAKYLPDTNALYPECSVKPSVQGNSKEETIKKWNTRSPQSLTEKVKLED